jgi:hypothetical protein
VAYVRYEEAEVNEAVIASASVPPHVAPVGPHAFLPGRPVTLVTVLGMIVDRASHTGLLISDLVTDREASTVLVETPAPEDVRAWAAAMAGAPTRRVVTPAHILTISRAVIGDWEITFRSVLPTPNGGTTT